MDDFALYNEPDLYDLVMSANPLADAFYLKEARQRRGAVLELACGSGRFSIPLVKAGVQLVGVDLSRQCWDVPVRMRPRQVLSSRC